MRTRAQVVDDGMTVDSGQPPVGYVGARFAPDRIEEILTDREALLLGALNDLIDQRGGARLRACEIVNEIESLSGAREGAR